MPLSKPNSRVVHNVRSRILGLAGHDQNDVLDHPFLESGVAERIEQAARAAKAFGVELIILDALHAHPSHVAVVGQTDLGTSGVRTDWDVAETEILSHYTGGAVNVALMKDGDFLPMGSPYGNKEFDKNAPVEAAQNRKLLQTIMKSAGFVGAEGDNWWHFEYGTHAWSEKTGGHTYLTEPILPPDTDGTHLLSQTRLSATSVFDGRIIAPIFSTAEDRHAVVGGLKSGHFYDRHSNSATEDLANYYRELMGVENVGLVESGLAACITALRGSVPKKGTIIFDSKIYYEVHRSILQIADDLDWTAVMCDMTDPANLEKALIDSGGASVVYADSPSNWFLEVLDIEALSKLAHTHGAKLVVDTTLQPLQNARAKGADVEVLSLSKYPSNGMALGGAFVGDDADLMSKIELRAACDGHTLARPVAQIIHQQSFSLHDRLRTVSEAAHKIADFLANHPDIEHVNVPLPEKLHGYSGGQISFLLRDASQGSRLEEVVSNNALSGFPLHLAGTFGTAITTIEHFASNPRHREGIPKEKTNEVSIPSNMVRLGVGLEDANEIIAALNFALNMSSASQPMPGIPRQMCSQKFGDTVPLVA